MPLCLLFEKKYLIEFWIIFCLHVVVDAEMVWKILYDSQVDPTQIASAALSVVWNMIQLLPIASHLICGISYAKDYSFNKSAFLVYLIIKWASFHCIFDSLVRTPNSSKPLWMQGNKRKVFKKELFFFCFMRGL